MFQSGLWQGQINQYSDGIASLFNSALQRQPDYQTALRLYTAMQPPIWPTSSSPEERFLGPGQASLLIDAAQSVEKLKRSAIHVRDNFRPLGLLIRPDLSSPQPLQAPPKWEPPIVQYPRPFYMQD